MSEARRIATNQLAIDLIRLKLRTDVNIDGSIIRSIQGRLQIFMRENETEISITAMLRDLIQEHCVEPLSILNFKGPLAFASDALSAELTGSSLKSGK
jgi:hypothetical protein